MHVRTVSGVLRTLTAIWRCNSYHNRCEELIFIHGKRSISEKQGEKEVHHKTEEIQTDWRSSLLVLCAADVLHRQESQDGERIFMQNIQELVKAKVDDR